MRVTNKLGKKKKKEGEGLKDKINWLREKFCIDKFKCNKE